MKLLYSCLHSFAPDYNRSASLPLPVQGEQAGSSSSEHGSVSPDSDMQHDMFLERTKRSVSEIQAKHPVAHLLRLSLCGVKIVF